MSNEKKRGFLDVLHGMFTSDAELDREREAGIRKAVRNAENALDHTRERIAELQKERDAKWNEAREYLRSGQKPLAQRSLMGVQSAEALMAGLERKCFVFRQMSFKLEMTSIDQKLVSAMRGLNASVSVDTDAIQSALENAGAVLADQENADKLWSKMYSKEMNGLGAQEIPSVDEMTQQLCDEVGIANEEAPAAEPVREKAKAEPVRI